MGLNFGLPNPNYSPENRNMQLKIVCIKYDENSHYPFYFERVSLILHLTGSDEGPPNCLAVVHCPFVECAQDHLLSSQPMLSGISL
jgi:hypothetical protein